MTFRIEHISDNAHFEHIGDVHVTGNIGKNARVKVIKGRLIVDGDIHGGAKVTANPKSRGVVGSTLHVKGSIHENVRVKSINGNLRIEYQVGKDSKIKLTNGNIAIGSLDTNASLDLINGNISVVDALANSRISLVNGTVKVTNADQSAVVRVTNGQSEVNGVNHTYPKIKNRARRVGTIYATHGDIVSYYNEGDDESNGLLRLTQLPDFQSLTRTQFNELDNKAKKHMFERSCQAFSEAANTMVNVDPLYAASAKQFIQQIQLGANLNFRDYDVNDALVKATSLIKTPIMLDGKTINPAVNQHIQDLSQTITLMQKDQRNHLIAGVSFALLATASLVVAIAVAALAFLTLGTTVILSTLLGVNSAACYGIAANSFWKAKQASNAVTLMQPLVIAAEAELGRVRLT